MIGNFKVAVLVGSSRYQQQYENVAEDLDLAGYIVYRTSVFSKAKDLKITLEQKNAQSEKFEMMIGEFADEVHVVVVDNYIGIHTSREISIAEDYNIPVYYHRFTSSKS